VEAEAVEKGVSHRQIIESALYDRYETLQQPSRDAVIARRLNRIDNRLSVIERQQDVIAEFLGTYIRMWFMVNDELPTKERSGAYSRSSERFERLTKKVAEQLRSNRGLVSELAKEFRR
jgi:hypothetical protein